MKALMSTLVISMISTSAFAFETGKYVCAAEKADSNGSKPVVQISLAKVSLKSDAGNITLPYMEYTFDDQKGNQAYAKGIAKISGETWANSLDGQTIQIDGTSFKIVFKGNKIVSQIGECRKLN